MKYESAPLRKPSLDEIARALDGEVSAGQVIAPGRAVCGQDRLYRSGQRRAWAKICTTRGATPSWHRGQGGNRGIAGTWGADCG